MFLLKVTKWTSDCSVILFAHGLSSSMTLCLDYTTTIVNIIINRVINYACYFLPIMRDISSGYLSNLTIQTWQFDLLIEQHNECMSNKDIAHHHHS